MTFANMQQLFLSGERIVAQELCSFGDHVGRPRDCFLMKGENSITSEMVPRITTRSYFTMFS